MFRWNMNMKVKTKSPGDANHYLKNNLKSHPLSFVFLKSEHNLNNEG